MRGKETRGDHITTEFRIPPAYAGKSSVPSQFRMNRRDHPRICGEKPVLPCQFMYVSGSPPHMRGKVVAHGCLLLDVGITPAYAGKREAASRGGRT